MAAALQHAWGSKIQTTTLPEGGTDLLATCSIACTTVVMDCTARSGVHAALLAACRASGGGDRLRWAPASSRHASCMLGHALAVQCVDFDAAEELGSSEFSAGMSRSSQVWPAAVQMPQAPHAMAFATCCALRRQSTRTRS